MRNKDQFYMEIAEVIAKASYAERNKVGALLEKGHNIIAFGYNGTPAGFDNCCETEDNATKPEVLHAESNAIAKCAKTGVSAEGATLYCTFSPCLECAKLIIQAGIRRVVYYHEYRSDEGKKLLIAAGIVIYQATPIFEEDMRKVAEELRTFRP